MQALALMVFCNLFDGTLKDFNLKCHNPYFNRWFSAIKNVNTYTRTNKAVTILILIDGFLQ